MTRRLRVTMLKANWDGSWSAYWPMFSNHSRLAWAARWVDATTGRRSASYAARASRMARRSATPPGTCSCRQAASASASSMASLVPEPIEKCAVCAASPSSTTFSCRQVRHLTVVKVVHRELFATKLWLPAPGPPSTSAHSPRMSSMEASSLRPGARPATPAISPNPARCQTSSCISRMKVLARSLYG